MKQLLVALPHVAKHPFALVAYLAVAIGWVTISLQVAKADKLFDTLKTLPERDRLEAIKLEYTTVPKEGLSASDWLESRKQNYLFAGYGATLFTGVVLTAFALVQSRRTVGGFRRAQLPSIGHVTGNVYITYSRLQERHPTSHSGVLCVVEDARFSSLNGTHLDLRFTIYNNYAELIKIFNFNTIEYQRQVTVHYCGNPRIFLKISPENPFIEQDKTFEIPPGQNVSFILRYTMMVGDGGINVILGIVAQYHTASGKAGAVRSDKLVLMKPEYRRTMLFDSETASSILDIKNEKSFSYGWVLESAQEQLQLLNDALERHRTV